MNKEKINNTILFVGRYNPTEILTGPEKVAKRVFHHRCKEEKAIFLQYFFDGKKYGYIKKLFGKEIINIDDRSYILTLGIFRIFILFLFNRPIIVHIITFERFCVLFYFFKLFRKTKIIYNVHGIITLGNYELKNVPLFYRLKDKFCERIFFKYSDIIIMPSEFYINIAEKYFKYDRSKVKIIPNGCDEEFHNINRSRKNVYELNIAVQTDKIGFDKSYKYLLYSITHFKSKINLYTIGEHNFHDLNHKDITIINEIRMPTGDYSVFLSNIDIFLSINKFDTFSISALEAMAAGAVTIVTEETGLSRYIENGKNGFVIKFSEIDTLINIVNSLLYYRDKFTTISNKAREIYEQLNWDNVYSKYAELYKGIV